MKIEKLRANLKKYEMSKISHSKLFDGFMFIFLLAIIALVIFMPISDQFCSEKGCWNFKTQRSVYCEKHYKSIYENYKEKQSSGSGASKRNYSSSYSQNYNRNSSSGKKNSTPSYSSRTYSNSFSAKQRDPYDANNYDDPDDFADDWAEEFGDGDYDSGYDDAYDYWESEYVK